MSPSGTHLGIAPPRLSLLAFLALALIAAACGETPTQPLEVEPSFAKATHWPGKIVFVSQASGNNDIYIMDADGTDILNLTGPNSVHEFSPELSPDGTRIAFTRNSQVWWMYASGRGARFVAAGYDPAWSPDGTQLVFTRNDDFNGPAPGIDVNLYVINADGTGELPLAIGPGTQHEPTWAPHQDVTYVSNGQLVGPGIPSGAFEGREPEWSPDGTKLAYHASQQYGGGAHVNDQIYVYEPGTLLPVRVTNTVDPIADRSPTFSPDGDHIVFMRTDDWNFDDFRQVSWSAVRGVWYQEPGALGSGLEPHWGPCAPSRTFPPC